jgi:hypothetical protein
MDASQGTQSTSTSTSEAFYCDKCKASFSGQKELGRHKKTASAHCPDKIPCYYPGCTKQPYQKQESVHTHVGRDHRDEIGRLAEVSDSTIELI